MFQLIATRLALFLPTLLAASMILFIAINVVPGSAARSALGVDATPQAIMRFEAQNGLDQPLLTQYVKWVAKALQGDFGKSFQNRVDVGSEIAKRIPVTLELSLFAIIIANLIAVPLGVLAAQRHMKAADTVIFLDLPPAICIARVVWRVLRYLGRSRPDMARGCPEKLDFKFLRWIWQYPRKNRPVILEKLTRLEQGQRVVRLRSAAAVRDFLNTTAQ